MAWEQVADLSALPAGGSINYNFDNVNYRYRFRNSIVFDRGLYVGSIRIIVPGNGTKSLDSYNFNGIHNIGRASDIVLERERTNTPPTTTSFTEPKSGTILKSGSSVDVKWNPSSDQDGDAISYLLEVSINNNNFQLLRDYSPTTGFIYTVPEANTVQFRVRAKDSKGAVSTYAYSDTFNVFVNSVPTLTLNTTANRTLYENDTFTVSGTATESDSGDVATVKYQINSGSARALETKISNGSAFPFNKVLTFKQNKLFDGANAITADLSEGTQHVLKVWVEDDKGGKSDELIRVFYVVPNRPATLTIEPFSDRTDLIDSDSVTINGSVADPDNNTVTVKYKIGNGSFTEVYSGSSGSFSFNLTLSALEVGANTITIQAVDSYGANTSKTLQVTKAENNQPLKTAVSRYKLTPPNGTAKGVVLWIQRETGDLIVDAEISMGMNGQAENFQPMAKASTAFVSDGIEEDEFTFDNGTEAENIVLKLTMTRSSIASDKGIKLISGALS